MKVSITDAKNHLSSLMRSIEKGEQVVITRNGKPVARLVRLRDESPPVRFGTMRGRINLKPGWDDPIDFYEAPATRI